MDIKELKVGARGSKLSLMQTKIFTSHICNFYDSMKEDNILTKIIKTSGDLKQSSRLDQLGGKGLFSKEIENHIVNGDIDIGLHSMKDIPTKLDKKFVIACWMPREDPHDVLITREGKNLDELDTGSIIGTSSIRRRSQILRIRKDIIIKALRGNIDTRIKKFKDGQYDAIILSIAGIRRLGISNLKFSILPYSLFLPAACQGAIGAEISKVNSNLHDFLNMASDNETEMCCLTERQVLHTINANCNTPIGVLANIKNNQINLRVEIYDHKGICIYENKKTSSFENAIQTAENLGNEILNNLGQKLIDSLDKINDFDYSP